jgi:uncharacterized membrane protein
VNLEITSVDINNKDRVVANGHTLNYKYERGEKLSIDVCVQALTDVTDAQVEADIFGYRYSNRDTTHPTTDTTSTFDLSENDSDCETLNLVVPELIDMDYYKLRIAVADRDGIETEQDYELHIQGVAADSAVQVKDFSFNPEEVIAGRAFTATVQVRNYGTSDLKDLKVTVEVPDLNIKASGYMDELNSDDSKTFEELLLRIPDCAKAGTYPVDITVDFDEYEQTVTSGSITVQSSDTCATTAPTTANQPDKTVISVPNSQEVAQGTGIVYPIVIANSGSASVTYSLSIAGASTWATTRIDPSSVVVVPNGQSKTVYLYVSANPDAELGDKVMTLTVDSGTESKQVTLTSRITKSAGADTTGFKNALEIGLVVLVIILLIIGLIIGFNKMKDNKQESEPYY